VVTAAAALAADTAAEDADVAALVALVAALLAEVRAEDALVAADEALVAAELADVKADEADVAALVALVAAEVALIAADAADASWSTRMASTYDFGAADELDIPALDKPVMTGEPEMVGLTKVAPDAVKEPVKVPAE